MAARQTKSNHDAAWCNAIQDDLRASIAKMQALPRLHLVRHYDVPPAPALGDLYRLPPLPLGRRLRLHLAELLLRALGFPNDAGSFARSRLDPIQPFVFDGREWRREMGGGHYEVISSDGCSRGGGGGGGAMAAIEAASAGFNEWHALMMTRLCPELRKSPSVDRLRELRRFFGTRGSELPSSRRPQP